jgi:hypothetical protein
MVTTRAFCACEKVKAKIVKTNPVAFLTIGQIPGNPFIDRIVTAPPVGGAVCGAPIPMETVLLRNTSVDQGISQQRITGAFHVIVAGVHNDFSINSFGEIDQNSNG